MNKTNWYDYTLVAWLVDNPREHDIVLYGPFESAESALEWGNLLKPEYKFRVRQMIKPTGNAD